MKAGFIAELEARSNSFQKVKAEMETLYAKQIGEDDLKKDVSKQVHIDNVLRSCESALTCYNGTLRGIKVAVVSWLH